MKLICDRKIKWSRVSLHKQRQKAEGRRQKEQLEKVSDPNKSGAGLSE
ncbi:MAG: hypothetical protein F6K17_25900 [Okeania sp. SIO3C4]|nr:hypothetical protein [Okeania sp. SIO3C4]